MNSHERDLALSVEEELKHFSPGWAVLARTSRSVPEWYDALIIDSFLTWRDGAGGDGCSAEPVM
ncbi:hypothetical protein BpHYR1_054396 [Brachionus plicatilis]|uniref:Uncharacterized protein n=1 Tax=Brachionus plicatilis TaxID=10195 RepID=A0A3M7QJH5_BRAPC|nr:hypothetical protein BpHYR1_054396 [Brachionus plicatilis]